MTEQDKAMQCMFLQLDDYENRNRRSNIRIRGLPKTVRADDLMHTLQGVFRSILGQKENKNYRN